MLLLLAFVPIVCAIFGSASAVEGYQDADAPQPLCPEGLEYINGLCYPQSRCPPDRFMHTDGLCYLINPEPCPFNETTSTTTTEEPTTSTTTTDEPTTTTTEEPTTTTTEEPTTTTTEEPTTTTTTTEEPTTTTTEEPTTTTTEEPTTSTTTTEEPTTTTTTTEEPTTTTTEEPTLPPLPPIEPPPDELVRCPPGSIFMDEQCRKILCSQGEYLAGRCLSPACPTGTVWRGKRCQPPGYITTILEIENVITNRKQYSAVTENVNNVEYVTLPPYDPAADNSNSYSAITTLSPPLDAATTTTTTTAPPVFEGIVPPDGCCIVKSPRICKSYPPKWVCFNRSQKLCDRRVCTRPVIYLKPPRVEVSSDPPLLVMPPNPPLAACETPNCSDSDALDCSGCAQNRRENCSAACYNYFCPSGSCQFMNAQDYCELYPGGFGCTKQDGCFWKWCGKECY